MAVLNVYRLQYQCNWESEGGTPWRVNIAQNHGAIRPQPKVRALGKAPVLKREQSDNVWGSSLELFLQCDVEGEFREFYTSDPLEWRVTLLSYDETASAWSTRWTGFIVPELYSAPVVGVPYDVQVIATDGLGELKRHDFHLSDVTDAYGVCSFRTCFDYLLNLTGLGYDVTNEDECPLLLSSLGDIDTGVQFIDAEFDLGFMEEDEATCYDVLQGLLRSMNAVVFRRNNRWWIWRETDTVISEGGVRPDFYDYFNSFTGWFGTQYTGTTSVEEATGGSRLYAITNESHWRDHYWPKGYLTEQIEPAARKVVVTNDYQLTSEAVLKDSTFRLATSDAPWAKSTDVTHAKGWYSIPGLHNNYIQQIVTLERAITGDFQLKVRGAVKITGNPVPSGPYTVVVDMEDQDSLEKLGRFSNGTYGWALPGSPSFTAPIELSLSTLNAEEELTIDFEDLPKRYKAKLSFGTSNLKLVAREFSIVSINGAKGIRAEVAISNNARNDDAEMSIPVSSGDRDDYILHSELMLTPSHLPIASVSTSKIAASKLVELIALDRVLQVAKPRVRLKGTLLTSTGTYVVSPLEPLGFIGYVIDAETPTYFLLQTYSRDLVNDEMDVELLSVPDASIDITDYSVSTEETDAPNKNTSTTR